MTDTTTALVSCDPELPEVASAARADRHPAAVYLARLAPGSRRTMREALETIAETLSNGTRTLQTLDWSQVRYQHTAAIRTALAERYAASTANKMLAALKGTLQEAWRLGLIEAEEYHRAVDLKAVRGETVPRGRALKAGELRALFAACAADQTAAGARDTAALALLYAAGLRRSELVSLDLADYDPETGALTVRSGKGNKGRVVYATNGAATALARWIEQRGSAPGPLFIPVWSGRRPLYRRMSDPNVRVLLKKRAKEAGVADFSPHDLRRTFVGDLLEAGADISTVQALAGHSNVQTTARYDRRGEKAKRRAAEMLHVPYAGEPTGEGPR
jgi:site-specific recombinase XerD